ncbi:hypothetical protein HN587_01150 [Candidatus Woesearchaeota archaeon]|jgi:hypothetical protein|nr:hypothetical protein [Candidatus Woesearchaeota archaeon]
MFEKFRSFKAEYDIAPDNLRLFVDELWAELNHSAVFRKFGSLQLASKMDFYGSGGELLYSAGSVNVSEFRDVNVAGLTIELVAKQVQGDHDTLLDDICFGQVTVGSKTEPVRLSVEGVNNLAVNPEPVYRVAEKYAIANVKGGD